jgi:2,5-diketo-D-gluconate reductase B
MMKMIKIGSLQVPAIGLGTYKLTGKDAIDIMLDAFRIGYRLIDTAQLYHNEEEVGTAIRQSGLRREEIKLITKVWPTNFSKDRFIPSVKESLKKLNTSYVDLLLIHWPHPQSEVNQYIHFLAQVQEEGMAKEIGVSNYNISQLEAVQRAGVNIVTNEIEYHPWIDPHKVIDWMQHHQMPVIAYTPLGRGMVMKDKTIAAIAMEHHRQPAQIVLRWMMQKENLIAIPKASSSKHLQENLEVFDFMLTEQEVKTINSLAGDHRRVVDAQPGARWD